MSRALLALAVLVASVASASATSITFQVRRAPVLHWTC